MRSYEHFVKDTMVDRLQSIVRAYEEHTYQNTSILSPSHEAREIVMTAQSAVSIISTVFAPMLRRYPLLKNKYVQNFEFLKL